MNSSPRRNKRNRDLLPDSFISTPLSPPPVPVGSPQIVVHEKGGHVHVLCPLSRISLLSQELQKDFPKETREKSTMFAGYFAHAGVAC